MKKSMCAKGDCTKSIICNKRDSKMTKEEFRNLTSHKITILDGATGSFLIDSGMPANCCVENWICEHENILIALQEQYVAAGSDIIYAPTFGANRGRLSSHHMEDDIVRLNTLPVQYTKKAAAGKALVAGNLSMTGSFLIEDEESFDRIVEIYKEQIKILSDAGCDLLAVETMANALEAKAAAVAAREVCDLPIMISLSFEENGHTYYGDNPKKALDILADTGIDVIGANCSVGPEKMIDVIKEFAANTDLPILAKPNAGLPKPGPHGKFVYDLSDDNYAVLMVNLIDAGASFVGGCCGTSPSYINKLSLLTSNMSR